VKGLNKPACQAQQVKRGRKKTNRIVALLGVYCLLHWSCGMKTMAIFILQATKIFVAASADK